jgi:hypothetical protein
MSFHAFKSAIAEIHVRLHGLFQPRIYPGLPLAPSLGTLIASTLWEIKAIR